MKLVDHCQELDTHFDNKENIEYLIDPVRNKLVILSVFDGNLLIVCVNTKLKTTQNNKDKHCAFPPGLLVQLVSMDSQPAVLRIHIEG